MAYESKEEFMTYPLGTEIVKYDEDYKTAQAIVVPSSVKEIEARAFEGFSNLTNIMISEGVLRIGDCAFKDCVNLKRIVIPKSVGEIGYQVFLGCKSLRELTISKSFEKDIRQLLDGKEMIIVNFKE